MHDIGVVAAMPGEAATWCVVGERMRQHRVIVSGVGLQRAAQAAEGLLAAGAQALLSWGVAGGLSETLQPGDLVMADRVVGNDGEETPDPGWRKPWAQALLQAGLAVSSGCLWCSAQAVTSVDEKQGLAAGGSVAVDMESAAVARVARLAGVPFVAVKGICDPADRAVSPELAGLLREDGRVRPAAVAAALARGPRTWRAMRRMNSDFSLACASLSRAARVLQVSCPA